MDAPSHNTLTFVKDTLSMKRGRYVAFSGGDGAGKTKQLQDLRHDFPDALFVREPGGTSVAERLRSVVVDPSEPDAWLELFIMMGARRDLYQRVVLPALTNGQDVFSDRSWLETVTYQILTGLSEEHLPWFMWMIKKMECPWPDLWIGLDVEPRIGLDRCAARGMTNAYDRRPIEYHERVRQALHRVPLLFTHMKTVIIDANPSYPEVRARVLAALRTNGFNC